MAKYKINNPNDCETVTIRITKNQYPKIYEAKVKELVEVCGMSQADAEAAVNGMVITLELMYSVSSGLFGIESEAVESCASSLYNPYTGENLIDWDEDDEEYYDEECPLPRYQESEYKEGDADTRTGEIFDNYYK